MNWKLVKWASIAFLVIGALVLFGGGSIIGITNPTDKLLGLTWYQIIAISNIFSIWAIVKLASY